MSKGRARSTGGRGVGGGHALVQLAARNNAEWCHILCRTHGLVGRFLPEVWVSAARTPDLYPDAVSLTTSATAERILGHVDESPGCSVKDSFGVIDLAAFGFRVLFEAEWVHREPRSAKAHRAGLGWKPVRDAGDLARWENAWAGEKMRRGVFLPALLSHPAVVILGVERGHQMTAGAILNFSTSAVGLSNVFAANGDLEGAYAGCLAAAGDLLPGLPIVGYEMPETLPVAQARGFRSVGRLAVWLKDSLPSRLLVSE